MTYDDRRAVRAPSAGQKITSPGSSQNVGNQHFPRDGVGDRDELSFDRLCGLIRDDPLRGACLAQKLQQGLRHRDYQVAACAYAVAAALYNRPDLQAALYSHPFFAGGYGPNPDRLLLHCCQFVYKGRSGSDGHRAGERARAMQAAFDAQVSPLNVLQMLTQCGSYDGIKDDSTPKLAQEFEDDSVSLNLGRSEEEPRRDQRRAEQEAAGEPLVPGDPPVAKAAPQPKQQKKKISVKGILDEFLLVRVGKLSPDHTAFRMQVNQKRHMVLTRRPDGEDGLAVFEGSFDT